MLEEYQEILKDLSAYAQLGQMFAGVFLCLKVFKRGSTKNIRPGPFVGGVVISILSFCHLRLSEAPPSVNSQIAIALSIGYLSFYYFWARPQELALLKKSLLTGGIILALFLGYAQVENPQVVAGRFGAGLMGLIFLVMTLPLLFIRRVIATKDTDNIPFPLAVSGLSIGLTRGLYAISLNLPIGAIALYFLVVLLAGTQVTLCLLFPSPARLPKQKRK